MESLDAAYGQLNTVQANAVLGDTGLNDGEFRKLVTCGDMNKAFGAVTSAWQMGVSVQKIRLALTMLCVERLLRAGHGSGANWDHLKQELASVRIIDKVKPMGGLIAYQVALHAVWQIVSHGDEGLADEIPELRACPIRSEDKQMAYVINGIEKSTPGAAVVQANSYLMGGHCAERLMRDTILWINENCVGGGYYDGQRSMIDAWYLANDHPERDRIVLALVGWMADYRKQHFKRSNRDGPI